MVLCWIALPVFALLGIFSAKYRRLTKESLDCMFRTVTLRKCRSGLDERIKGDVTGKLMRFSPGLAKGFFRYYKIIAWIILIIFIWSAYASALGMYNYYKHGNCNGVEGGFCILPGGNDYDTKALALEYGLDEKELADCLEKNRYLGKEECLNYCLGI
ncbi:hypothetical protein GW923_04930 [Candidatus Pacearchaeota archaeon]|nr:hypothetical protein [Candidatus Pacearchaeota archaeon]OIO44431.1 MAG: hypothetical protein AUJ64_00115 [Candidatus Pacearchaeota archaeon CG1_02_39_14]